jgi:uncharacterized protein YidB (DUF937 family)
MGLFDFLKSADKKAAPTASGAAAGGGAMAAGSAEESAISSLLGEGGGQLSGLMDKFGAGGLEDTVKSWVGKGSNLPVSADQIKSVLGSDQVAAVAAKLGISSDAAAGKIADVLPKVIDKLTPDGIVPDPAALADKVKGFIKI